MRRDLSEVVRPPETCDGELGSRLRPRVDLTDGLAAPHGLPPTHEELDPDGRIDVVFDLPPPRPELNGRDSDFIRIGARDESVGRSFPRPPQRRFREDLGT